MDNFLIEIEKKLKSVVEREKRRDGIYRLARNLILSCAVILFFILIEAFGYFSPAVKTILVIILSAILISLLLAVIYPIIKDYFYFKNPDYVKTANEVGKQFPEIKDELANAIQLTLEKNSNYSSQLIAAAFKKVYDKSRDLNFNTVVDFSRTNRFVKMSAGIIFIFILILLIVKPVNSAAYRLINYNKSFAPPQKFYFEIYPGNVEITKGDNVTIKIKAIGQKPGQIILSTKYSEQAEFAEKSLSPDSLGNFSFEMTAVKSSFNYFVSAEGIESDVFKISVLNRPIISGYELKITPPAYSKLPEVIQKDNGNITALPGSRVQIKIDASRELSNAKIIFSDSTEKQMQINDASGIASFNIMRETNYQMLITDAQGFQNINPITYSIKILADEQPSIELIAPDIKNSNSVIKLGSDPKISVAAKIKDDYGFTKLNLNYRLSASKYRQISEQYFQIPISINKDTREDEVYYVWDLSTLVLAEGEAVSCYLEIFDNDIVSGPKSAKTEMFTIQVPSMDELFAGAENTQQEASKDLAETFKEAEQLQREMQKISDDLKQNNREISWQEKERVEKAVQKFNELSNKIEEVSQKLSEMQKDLTNNNLLSKETLDKYNELQKLLDEMNTDEMKAALKRLQDSLKNMMRDNVQMSMEEMKANEDYFKKSIERTLNLLKRVQIEQKIDELIKRTEDLTEKLDELKDKTINSNLSDQQKKNELSNRQKDITKDIKNLEKEMSNLNDRMSELKDMPKDEIENAMNEFEKQKNDELSEEALKDLQQIQKMKAMQNQQQLSQNMQSMNKKFKDMQSSMQQKNQMKTFYEMMKILNDLLTLSKSQEELKNKTDEMGHVSQKIQQSTREQSELQESLNKVLQNLSALSQKSFTITPEMGNALGKSFSEMQNSITSMQNQNGALASQFQKQAMQHINEAASMMKRGMDNIMNGGQGGGMMSMMQQLQQLSQQQMQLNQMTQMLNQGRMTPEMASQIQRLAQQQELIRKSLDQMNREARESGESKRFAANLDKIMQDMKEVVTNLQTDKINDDLIKQQEKILSRMLDAQRSINERDFEKNRKSNTGKNSARTSPPDLILSTDEGRNKLKNELMKAIGEGYKKDYEDLIRNYFEALEKLNKN
jgi:hypothetical protein